MDTNEKFPSCDLYIKLFDNTGKRFFDLDQLNDILTQKANVIQRYAYIIVNKTICTNSHRECAHEESPQYVDLTYVHMTLQFFPQCPQCKSDVASWFNISEVEVHPHRESFDNKLLFLAYDGTPPKGTFTPVGIRANFDVQHAINYAIDQKKLECIFGRILYGNDGRLLPCSEVEKIQNRLLIMTEPFFNSRCGKAELGRWISHVLFNTPYKG